MKMNSLFYAALLLASCSRDKPVERPQDFAGIPRPSAEPSVSVRAATSMIPTDTAKYWVRYVLNKAPRTGDSVRVRLYRDTLVIATRYRGATRDSALFSTLKVYGRSASYKGCAVVRGRDGKLGVERCDAFSTNLPAVVDTTPPVVDTVKVRDSLVVVGLDLKPDTATVRAGLDQQFCAFVKFNDGKIAIRSQDKNNPTCATEYARLPAAVRPTTVSTTRQALADKVCVDWKAEGGTITAEQCGTPS